MDLEREYIIDICKDGTITYRHRLAKSFNGAALPCFSVDNPEEAKALQLHFCKLQYNAHPLMPGQPWYKLYPWSSIVEDIPHVTRLFRLYYLRMKD